LLPAWIEPHQYGRTPLGHGLGKLVGKVIHGEF
jgi:hypothetical protein